jgi:hypothetical protein
MATIVYDIDGNFLRKEDERDLQEAIDNNIKLLKDSCTTALNKAGLDTSTQQNAALGIYDEDRCEAIKSYIVSCRNEYLRCKGLILAATTNDEADAVQFVAPAIPEGL